MTQALLLLPLLPFLLNVLDPGVLLRLRLDIHPGGNGPLFEDLLFPRTHRGQEQFIQRDVEVRAKVDGLVKAYSAGLALESRQRRLAHPQFRCLLPLIQSTPFSKTAEPIPYEQVIAALAGFDHSRDVGTWRPKRSKAGLWDATVL